MEHNSKRKTKRPVPLRVWDTESRNTDDLMLAVYFFDCPYSHPSPCGRTRMRGVFLYCNSMSFLAMWKAPRNDIFCNSLTSTPFLSFQDYKNIFSTEYNLCCFSEICQKNCIFLPMPCNSHLVFLYNQTHALLELASHSFLSPFYLDAWLNSPSLYPASWDWIHQKNLKHLLSFWEMLKFYFGLFKFVQY